jgi:hypothetical protein
MVYPKYFDLNIGKNVLSHLTVEDALKEIIANALDEHKLSEISKDIKIYKNTANKWCIRDYGSGITSSNFKFNINHKKEKNYDVIGMYGYGLKDAFGTLMSKGIKFKIYTETHSYTPIFRCKPDFVDEETIHIEINKNKTHEISCGTEFVFENLNLDYITRAKSKFIKFINPQITYSSHDFKMFTLDSHQSIFINGVEVNTDTGFHFSYDIKRSENIDKCFNRDRKQMDMKQLKPYIIKLLKNLQLVFDDTHQTINDTLRHICESNTSDFLGEFNQRDILRNIITQFNSLDKYVFVGTKERVTTEIKNKIDDDEKEIFKLGNGIKTKLGVKNIKDLYHKDKFYAKYDDSSYHINTLLNYVIDPKQHNIQNYISEVIKQIDKLIKIPEELKQKIYDIELVPEYDDSNSDSDSDSNSNSDSDEELNTLDKHGYDFTGNKLKITTHFTQEKNKSKLHVILFRYIIKVIDDDSINQLLEQPKRGWFG